jgi:hypothetical protein
MKTVAKFASVLVLLSGLSVLAQNKNINQADIDHEVDGAFSYETTDPFGNDVTVVVDPPAANPVDQPWDDPEHPLFRGWEVEEGDKFQQKARVNVDVYAVADEEYRAAYGNWQNRLYQIIETADNAYVRDFDINWIIQGYYSWTSNGGNSSAILGDLASDGSGLPDGLCMGFTRDSNFTAGGIAYVYSYDPGTGYSVCLDQGVSSTTYALRHEIGHNYGCSHDFDPVVCLMNYTYSYSIDYFDNAHENLINSHQGWFQ